VNAFLALVALGQSIVGTQAPEIVGDQWLNTKEPVMMKNRTGKVTLIHFWTFACINCKNNLPAVKRLTEKFKDDGVVTIGIHTPEIEIEKNFEEVKKRTAKLGIEYPVVMDGEYKNWKSYQVTAWPTVYVIDKKGRIRGGWIGELNYQNANGEGKMSTLIQQLLKEK
jgi:alkyl hydroperoxide reductase subunit AhpC